MPAGRPPLYNTPEDMQDTIDEYFNSCIPELLKDEEGNIMTTKSGKPVYQLNPPTITGLALALGFNSRGTIYEYEKKNDIFSDTIKKARLRCENYAEKALMSGEINPAGPIFVLKNYGWSDRHEITGENGEPLRITMVPASTIEVEDMDA